MAGISPWSPGVTYVTVWLVARVFPIRVAGASGPLKGETTWEELGLPEERTTVTHKVRRVGEWDSELIRQAVVANGGATFRQKHEFMMENFEVLVALTMADQKIPSLRDKSRWMDLVEDDQLALNDLIREVQNDAGVAVGMIATGPKAVLPQW
jgi:adenylosuccinate synthase